MTFGLLVQKTKSAQARTMLLLAIAAFLTKLPLLRKPAELQYGLSVANFPSGTETLAMLMQVKSVLDQSRLKKEWHNVAFMQVNGHGQVLSLTQHLIITVRLTSCTRRLKIWCQIALLPLNTFFLQCALTVSTYSFKIRRATVIQVPVYMKHIKLFGTFTFKSTFLTMLLLSISQLIPTGFLRSSAATTCIALTTIKYFFIFIIVYSTRAFTTCLTQRTHTLFSNRPFLALFNSY